MSSRLWPLQMFDPKAEYTVLERKLPHWSQSGTVCFITWRTIDSIPRSVLKRWYADREDWLRQHGINSRDPAWKEELHRRDPHVQREFVRTFSDRWHRQLDSGHGACVLRQSALSQIVANSLLKFDDDRYQLTDFVVMPNHVHLLAAFVDEEGMLACCRSWKHYTACEINRSIGRSESFWQQDGFDHLVRTEEQFLAFRRYIARNGAKARLKPEEFRHYSKSL